MTTVKFLSTEYGNYLDGYYVRDYKEFIETLQKQVKFTRKVNLGVIDGLTLSNRFQGDFQGINSAIVESSKYGTHLYKIVGREFIRRDLWHITMVKDVISANFNNILQSDVLVARLGLDTKVFDPLLFNQEQMMVSQVKSGQINLGELNNAKSYGYLAIWAKDTISKEYSIQEQGIIYDIEYNLDIPVIAELSKVSDWEGYGKNKVQSVNNTFEVAFEMRQYGKFVTYLVFSGRDGEYSRELNRYSKGVFATIDINIRDDLTAQVIYMGVKSEIEKYFKDIQTEIDDNIAIPNSWEDFNKYVGKNIKVINEFEEEEFFEIEQVIDSQSSDYSMNEYFKDYVRKSLLLSNTNVNITYNSNVNFSILQEVKIYGYRYNKIFPEIIKLDTLSKYNKTIDQPYEMFYIPMIEGANIVVNDGKVYRFNKEVIEGFLYELISRYGGSNPKLIDVQIIPYSPTQHIKNNWDGINTLFVNDGEAVDIIEIKDTVVPIYNVPYSKYNGELNVKIDVDDYKISQQERYILTSPSGANQYEFSISKNKGLEKLVIKGNLRPFASFFQIQPIFKGLYGSNYVDTRGLIWQEDSSLTQTSSQWETYKRQNVNYLNSFNEGQEFRRNELSLHQVTNWGNYGFDASKRFIEASLEAVKVGADMVAKDAYFGIKGGISGGAAGTAIMGAYVGTEAIEAGQLGYNHKMQNRLLDLELSYARKQFNYELQNIKYIPENLNKVSGVFQTNNIEPYIQIFKPTIEEVNYLVNYFRLNGVNIGQVVDLSVKEFNYMQGVIVRYSGIIIESEYQELHSQLSKGVREYGWKL